MESRILGKTDLKVSKLGLGCATFGREIDEEASFRIMDFAFEQGINFHVFSVFINGKPK